MRFRKFVKYQGKTFDEILFEMKRMIFKNEIEERELDEEDSAEDSTGGTDASPRVEEIKSSLKNNGLDVLRDKVMKQTVNDKQFRQ